MGFNLKRVASGIASGGLSELVPKGGVDPARVQAGISSGGISELMRAAQLKNPLNPGSTTQAQVPLETPEQRAARIKLMGFADTGEFGGFKAGADVGIQPGDYSMSGLESSGQTSLQQLLSSGIPSQFQLGDKALTDLLNPDPNYIQSQFDPFKAQVQRQITQSNNDLKRGAGFAGNLYSTGTIKGLGDIQARGNETLTAQLASLTNDALNRRAAAIPLAYQSGTAQENLVQNRIASSQQYGGLSRTLNNARTDASNAELLRRRNELLLPINAASTVAGNNANFGIPQVTVQNPNPMLDLLTAIIGGGSKILAAKAA